MAVEAHENANPDRRHGFTLRVVRFNPDRKGVPFLPVPTVDALRQALSPFVDHKWLVVYLERDRGEAGSVWLHVSGDRAWVTHFTEPGGLDSYCRDVGYDGPDLAVEFWLDNGQADEIHRYWTVTRAEGLQALEYFLRHAGKDPGLDWVSEPGSLQDRP